MKTFDITTSTFTLLTNYTKDHQHTPQLTLDNTAIPHKHSTKLLGVTYDTSLSFKNHIHDIKQKCPHRLNMLRTLTGTDLGQHKETITLIYKQYICSVLEYASPAWAPNLATNQHNTLKTIQNNALRIITGCTQTTPTNHQHNETQVPTLQDNINMRGTQFLAAANTNLDHICPTCRRTNQLHIASKLPHKHYTLDSSAPSSSTLVHTSTRTSQTYIYKNSLPTQY